MERQASRVRGWSVSHESEALLMCTQFDDRPYSSKLLEEGRSTSCAPWRTLRSYGFVQQFQEPLARGFFDDLDVRLVLSHDRELLVNDDRLPSAPLPTRLHGHEAALDPRRDRSVEGDGHRYRVRKLEPPSHSLWTTLWMSTQN